MLPTDRPIPVGEDEWFHIPGFRKFLQSGKRRQGVGPATYNPVCFDESR
jgi:hypothetical protein